MTTALLVAPLDIVFLDRESLPDGVVLRPFGFPHRLISHPRSAPLDVAARIADADVVITSKAKVLADSIGGARRLKLIAVAATGTDNVDLASCAARGVPVTNVRDYAVNTVPEHTFALLLALRRSIVPYWQSVAAGRWQELGSSASLTIRSATLLARPSGSSEAVPSARPLPTLHAPSACRSCSQAGRVLRQYRQTARPSRRSSREAT